MIPFLTSNGDPRQLAEVVAPSLNRQNSKKSAELVEGKKRGKSRTSKEKKELAFKLGISLEDLVGF